MPAKAALLSNDLQRLWGQVSDRLRDARLRRNLTAEQVARSAGITRVTLHRLERGDPSVTVATFLKVLDSLRMAQDLAEVAEDGAKRTAQEQLPPRRLPTKIRVDAYPQLRQIAWHLSGADATLTPKEALELYERNWRHIDQGEVLPKERALIKKLVDTVGKGVLLV
ncbi:helix-turn-helix domain-containing protein [Roseateles sp. MS654]|uniref:helix-turn-helix domain-containing protein n=1 Tax=Roseateles sp. MS654 TaxID=3412685 RepID=UPI003C2FF436